ncbi:XPG domain containing-domain-containing protein [Bombardia bombarda]|uniref:XPG domain containing-domain-containing protein n=1 Tax=Bombardia bombarda TaxID=252184 RepID=A0AA40CGD7_9PEZI|nr:XPG domain containing-domain-containing protein [Bombardia bombarda]
MGIPHFKRHLEPYAQRGIVTPGSVSVALDGPALAYHVLNLCQRKSLRSSPFEQPAYELLGQTAIAWLDQIQACGLLVTAIFFDGFLPKSKQPERVQRVMKVSRDLCNYHKAFLTNVPQERPHVAETAPPPVDLFPTAWGGEASKKPPPPPFLVPAVIDALRRSSQYGPLTKVVPGEADGFCAHHVRLHGGAVLTSDSDLLVHQLGPDGSVIFFGDIDVDSESVVLTALQYRTSDICKSLAIKPDDGLLNLAFELIMDPHISLDQALERCRKETGIAKFPYDYSEFIKQYLTPEVATNIEVEDDLGMDPRISEIALQHVFGSSAKKAPSPTKTSNTSRPQDGELAMYLPFLLDSPSRTSAWESSKRIRQLAYSLLQQSTQDVTVIHSVSEFRRLQSLSAGVRVEVPPPSSIDAEATALLDVLSKVETSVTPAPETVWMNLSIYQDIILTMGQGKTSRPLGVELLSQEAAKKFDPYSWDSLHFLAQAQATYYSLRMLKQMLDFTLRHTGDVAASVSKLARSISLLPSLSEFPSPRNFEGMLRRVNEAGGLACLAAVLPHYIRSLQPKTESTELETSPKSKKRNKRQKTSHDDSRVVSLGGKTGSSSRNPYYILDVEE